MALTEIDRKLIKRCVKGERDAWYEFVDRFLGVVYHVIHHTAHMRSAVLQPDEVEDLAADVMARFVADNFKVLRKFKGKSSLATYLAVIARRVVVNQLSYRQSIERLKVKRNQEREAFENPPELALENADEVDRLLEGLDGRDSEIVRSFYLERKSYREISEDLGIPENSIGPILARLRNKLRKAASNT